MKKFFRKITNINEGEGKRVMIMAGYAFVVIASYNILKPMTRSLFVSKLGLDQLPFLFMLLALVIVVVVMIYMQISAIVRFDRLVNGTNFFLILNLLGFRWFLSLEAQSPVLYYGLFIWASIYGVLTTTQFWILANHLFNAREAKRLFPILISAAILGGIAGGYITNFFVAYIGGTADLAYVGILLLVCTIVLMNMAWPYRDRSLERTQRVQAKQEPHTMKVALEVFTLIRGSRHLALLLGIIFLTYLVVQIADFQFTAFASQSNSQTDDLTAFLGFWLSTMSVIALLFQLFFSGVIIQRFGVGATILFLPAALLICSAWVFASYGLVSVLALKIGDGAFRHSINKVGTELLYLPIPAETKKKTKAFVDMFADRFARGVAGLLLLIFYTTFGLSVAQISLISIILVGAWLFLSLSTYKEYVNSFRQALANRRIDADEVMNGVIKDEDTINSLIVSLASRNERHVVYALRMLLSVKGVELVPPVLPLLRNGTAEIRQHGLRLLRRHGDISLWPDISPYLRDEDKQVREETVRFFIDHAKAGIHDQLEEWLRDDDQGLRCATLYCIAENAEIAKELLSAELVGQFLADGRTGRLQIAEALGIFSDRQYYPFLEKLLHDSDKEVKSRAILSVGYTKDHQFVPLLLDNLEDRDFRKGAREALAEFGDGIMDTMASCIKDPAVSRKIRSEATRVLSLIGSQNSVSVLLDNLRETDEFLRLQVIRALNKVRTRFPDLKFDRRVDDALTNELKRYLQILAALHITENQNGEPGRGQPSLLERALQERLDDHIDRIFRLLGLRYPPKDIYNAYAATTSSNRSIRANAVEFLDNILSANLKRILIPIMEELPTERVLQNANGLVDIEFKDRLEALRYLVRNGDDWIRSCAIFEVGRCGLVPQFRDLIELLKEDDSPLVQETINHVLRQYA